ncbi:hybrid sensor histidine kinase/response regulator [Nostoc sp. TCL26-01]|uniref:ATP-binding response regulator n=1 Tax=Nostoc sp. TCL26-01 TaxID=2576904 RepID=UPI0015BFE04A|nr:hybrid sensor histidine kinase/response regulator [Nostoc sp. TCL26-01]QLE58997.1 hybrid sensor histidine kinase/response regulator [Nostoc sp. TCL26-01]
MSMLQYPLDEFLVTVSSCCETSTLAMVLEMFEQEQCDRLVIVNQQQCPVGLLYSGQLAQKFLATAGDELFVNLQKPLLNLSQALIEPIQILPASHRIEQLSSFWQYHPGQTHNIESALVDAEGKFLGLLNSVKLLALLAKEQVKTGAIASRYSASPNSSIRQNQNTNTEQLGESSFRRSATLGKTPSPKSYQHQIQLHQPLVQLLERLPWPLMLQTSGGEILTQNLAWWQQLGTLKDPEGIRQQVEAILAATRIKQPEYIGQKPAPHHRSHEQVGEESVSSLPTTGLLPVSPQNPYEAGENPKNSASRCFLDRQMGTCTCVVEVEDGQERVWQFAKIPLDSPDLKFANTDNLWLVLATDVTEQQQLCKELAAKNADLVQLNRLKDEFLACISHELKTPLTAVLGLSRLLVDQQLGKLNERQARYAGLIHQSGRHLMSVVNDILDLTRMETGQMDLTLVPVSIRAVCDRALSEAKAIHNQTSKTPTANQTATIQPSIPEFTLSIEPGLDQIVADELRLRQMLVHLLSNAFKFTEISGEIGLRVSRWEGWVAFTVWDTGIGIPEHQQHLIFQKFQQLENPLTRQFEGTGLGLVLTRALARLHGGDVSFLSRESKGSQFTLLLPPSPPTGSFADSEEEITEEPDTSSRTTATSKQLVANPGQNYPACSPRLVLVVEAVARYIEDLTDQLKSLGYRVVIARSGTEAVEKARRLQPKAIFLNPLLPLLSGWDVLTLLKSDAATRHISVVVTATGAEKELAFANRADGFLSLPVEQQSLIPLLDKLCAAPQEQQPGLENDENIERKKPLRILRLVNPELESTTSHSSLQEHRIIEVDDLDQAELLARVWQFDVILLDVEPSLAQKYLKELVQHPRLAALPLVTCDVATTLAASQIPGLSVFPCLTPLGVDNHTQKIDPLLSVLQIASGICYPPSILVVDLTMLQDIPQPKRRQAKGYSTQKSSGETPERGTEWFQALIQYLQTAGLKATMARCWAEVIQQIRHQNVDLLLICLGESTIHPEILQALTALPDLPFDLPPILVIEQRLNHVQVSSRSKLTSVKRTHLPKTEVESVQTIVKAIATHVVPRSTSMEDLLNQIHQALSLNERQRRCDG